VNGTETVCFVWIIPFLGDGARLVRANCCRYTGASGEAVV
jgi:hypothetical protein